VDINPCAIERSREKTDFEYPGAGCVKIQQGDACDLNFIKNESVDFICTHPPYADIIHYSYDIQGDLSLLKVKDFLLSMKNVAVECFRVLKPGKFCAILMGDTRKKGCVIPMSFEIMQLCSYYGEVRMFCIAYVTA
jgi:DNA modification methylase